MRYGTLLLYSTNCKYSTLKLFCNMQMTFNVIKYLHANYVLLFHCRNVLLTPYAPIVLPGTQSVPRWTIPTMYQQSQYAMMSSAVQNYGYILPQQMASQQQMVQPIQVVPSPQARLIRSSEMVRSQQMMTYMRLPGDHQVHLYHKQLQQHLVYSNSNNR